MSSGRKSGRTTTDPCGLDIKRWRQNTDCGPTWFLTFTHGRRLNVGTSSFSILKPSLVALQKKEEMEGDGWPLANGCTSSYADPVWVHTPPSTYTPIMTAGFLFKASLTRLFLHTASVNTHSGVVHVLATPRLVSLNVNSHVGITPVFINPLTPEPWFR